MPAQIITADDLQTFKQELLNDIKELLGKRQTEKKWLKSEDVRKMLSISPGTLQTLRINRTLPFTKIGGTIYYDHDDVIKVLTQNKREAQQ